MDDSSSSEDEAESSLELQNVSMNVIGSAYHSSDDSDSDENEEGTEESSNSDTDSDYVEEGNDESASGESTPEAEFEFD